MLILSLFYGLYHTLSSFCRPSHSLSPFLSQTHAHDLTLTLSLSFALSIFLSPPLWYTCSYSGLYCRLSTLLFSLYLSLSLLSSHSYTCSYCLSSMVSITHSLPFALHLAPSLLLCLKHMLEIFQFDGLNHTLSVSLLLCLIKHTHTLSLFRHLSHTHCISLSPCLSLLYTCSNSLNLIVSIIHSHYFLFLYPLSPSLSQSYAILSCLSSLI